MHLRENRMNRTDRLAEQLLEDNIATHVRRIAEDADARFHDLGANCESPIERLMLAALMFIKPQCLHPRYEGAGDLEREGRLHTQYRLGNRRLDFAYIVQPIHEPWTIRIGIECDGHEFHSTKAQKANDNERTVEIAEEGFNVLRFSGTQIFADPNGCAQSVADVVDGIYARHIHDEVWARHGKVYVGPVGPLLAAIADKAREGQQ